MKVPKLTNGGIMASKNEAMLVESALSDQPYIVYDPLLTLIAQVADANAKGQDAYLTVGATKDKLTLVLTLNVSGEKASVYGPTLVMLSQAATELL